MDRIKYNLRDNTNVTVHYPQDGNNKFVVEWEGVYIGYLYFAGIDYDEHEMIWFASSDLLNVYLEEITDYLEGRTTGS